MNALSPKASALLTMLRAKAECFETIHGKQWGSVYLDNARPAFMSARSFAGHLSALKAAGLYRSEGDDCFGLVAMEENE